MKEPTAIAQFALELVQLARSRGLAVEDAVTAMGSAAKALAVHADLLRPHSAMVATAADWLAAGYDVQVTEKDVAALFANANLCVVPPRSARSDDIDDVWPIVNITVSDSGEVTSAKLYAPGLPPGNHDVYPVRVPYMDEHTEAWLAVAKALEQVAPGYLDGSGNGIECAVKAIHRLTAVTGKSCGACEETGYAGKGEPCRHCAAPTASSALPERDTNKPAGQQGLFRKFDVRRVDGSDAPGGKHHGCRNFVLDVDHDPFAAAALGAYAAACEAFLPELARELREKWDALPLATSASPSALTDSPLVTLFSEAVAWGRAYGPALDGDAWDSTRKEKVTHLVMSAIPHWRMAAMSKSATDTGIDAAMSASKVATDAEGWQPITTPGQVSVGDKLRFTIGDEEYRETVKDLIEPGTDKEEIIYNIRRNYYLITSMAIANMGSQKNVRFLRASMVGRDGRGQ